MRRRVTGVRSTDSPASTPRVSIVLAAASVAAVGAFTGFGIAGVGPLAALAGDQQDDPTVVQEVTPSDGGGADNAPTQTPEPASPGTTTADPRTGLAVARVGFAGHGRGFADSGVGIACPGDGGADLRGTGCRRPGPVVGEPRRGRTHDPGVDRGPRSRRPQPCRARSADR